MTDTPAAPDTPPPDRKNWTWAARERCPDCGFDPVQVRHADVGPLVRDYAASICAAARGPRGTIRPQPEVWSPLEYGCHVRDVCAIFGARLRRMLAEDDPQFANWDQDETALAEQYWRQRPGPVCGQLTATADVLAEQFEAVRDDEWARPSRRSDGSTFDVESFARYLLHDLAHHAWDVRSAENL